MQLKGECADQQSKVAEEVMTQLIEARKSLNVKASEAFENNDACKHRICSVAANEFSKLIRENM